MSSNNAMRREGVHTHTHTEGERGKYTRKTISPAEMRNCNRKTDRYDEFPVVSSVPSRLNIKHARNENQSIQCTDFNGVYHTYGFPYAPFYTIAGCFSWLLSIFYSFFCPLLSHPFVRSPTHKWLYGAHLSAQRCNHYNFIVTQTCETVCGAPNGTESEIGKRKADEIPNQI